MTNLSQLRVFVNQPDDQVNHCWVFDLMEILDPDNGDQGTFYYLNYDEGSVQSEPSDHIFDNILDEMDNMREVRPPTWLVRHLTAPGYRMAEGL